MKALAILTTSLLALSPPVHAQGGETLLRANDKVMISIAGVPQEEVATISKTYTISDSGKVNLLHLGELTAAGLKPSALEKKIEEAYKAAEIYTHPTVTVSMDATTDGARQVSVISGCVQNGSVPYREGLTLLDAIGARGGPSPYGKTTRTQIIRTSSNGQRTTSVHDLKKITKGSEPDVPLMPGDKIIIPE